MVLRRLCIGLLGVEACLVGGVRQAGLVSEVRDLPFQTCQFVALPVGFRFQGVEMVLQRLQGAIQGVQLEPLSESRQLSLLLGALVHGAA